MALYTEHENSLFIVQLDTNERMSVQFPPDNVVWGLTSEESTLSVVSRNNPLINYTGVQDQLRLSLDFYSTESGSADVIRKVRWLKSLSMRDGIKPKPKVALVFGSLFEFEKWTVSQVNPDLRILRREDGYMPRYAKVDCVFKFDPDNNVTYDDIRI